jgi:L-iditol 2-dehydrogenase
VQALAKVRTGPDSLALVERPAPVAGPGEAVLAVQAAGICGTDVHIAADEYRVAIPVVLGHELCGIVESVGDAVDAALVGARFVVDPRLSSCEGCDACHTGHPNLCSDLRAIGVAVDGGFASHVVVSAGGLHEVPDSLPSHEATLAEPLACVCNCLLDPPAITPGDTVLVVGPGPIGLLVAQVARSSGGRVTILGTSRDRIRLDIAQALGFEALETDHAPDSVFDVVVECSGAASGIAYALTHATPRGRYVQVGLVGRPVEVPFDEICLRELSVRTGVGSTPRTWSLALRLIRSGELELSPLITHRVALEDWEGAFDLVTRAGGLKVVFEPGPPR